MTKSYVRTATRTTLKVEANLTQILNFKANLHTEFEPFNISSPHANLTQILNFKANFHTEFEPFNISSPQYLSLIFSQWAKCSMKLRGVTYSSAEQFMMKCKAVWF